MMDGVARCGGMANIELPEVVPWLPTWKAWPSSLSSGLPSRESWLSGRYSSPWPAPAAEGSGLSDACGECSAEARRAASRCWRSREGEPAELVSGSRCWRA
jgi:hypothetical protein